MEVDQGGSSCWKSKGIEQNYTEVYGIAEERQRRLGVIGKETVFYILVSLVFSGCRSRVGRAPGALPWATPFM